MKDGFVIYKSFYEPIKHLTDEQMGRLFRAIFEWQVNGKDIADADIKIAFYFFKNQMEIDSKKYKETCERRGSSGYLGGRPKHETKSEEENQMVLEKANGFGKSKRFSENQMVLEKAKEPDKDKDKDKDNNYYPTLPPLGETAEENNSANEVEETLNPSKIPKQRKKEKEKSSAKKEKELTYPYQSERFMAAWNNLLLCPKWRKKLPYTLQLALNKLAKYEEEFAIRQMELAAMNDWQGIVFQDTDEKYQKYLAEKQGSYKHPATNFKNDVEYTVF